MNQIAIVLQAFEQYPLVVVAFCLITISIASIMYRLLLHPKLKNITNIAEDNTRHVISIKNDLVALVERVEKSIERFIQIHVYSISSEIQKNQEKNEKDHVVMFDKIDGLQKDYHSNEKRITLLEKH